MSQFQRKLLGLIALGLLVAGLVQMRAHNDSQIGGILFRTGLGLLAIWLAWPQLNRKTLSLTSLAIGLGCVILAAAAKGRALLFVGLILVVALILHTFGRRVTASLTRPRQSRSNSKVKPD